MLEAAAHVFAEVGYEAATMSEIASRAGSCIGSVYQFFPNKRAVTQALKAEYASRIQDRWRPLEERASSLTMQELVARLIGISVAFLDENPGFVALMDAPASTHDPSIRVIFRETMARILAIRLRMPWSELMRTSAVTLQLLRAMNELYVEGTPRERKRIMHEFEMILTCYLAAKPSIGKTVKGTSAK